MKKYIASVEVPDDWVPNYGETSVDFYFITTAGASQMESTQMMSHEDWMELYGKRLASGKE